MTTRQSVEFAESILEAAARHHIMIHFHGVWKPTGLERTYPNLMNHEGALNLEYLKWSDRCTPEHDLMMAFTRLIAGPMDYHLGGFRAVPRAQFKPRNVAPNVLGTRCHMLGMYVCFDNPNPMLADYPTAYEGQPGFEFLELVPTWWDETRVLAGQVGELLVTARRKGATWYLGGISANGPRELALPLTFLGPGRYAARIWKDAPDAESDPNHLATETLQRHRRPTQLTAPARAGRRFCGATGAGEEVIRSETRGDSLSTTKLRPCSGVSLRPPDPAAWFRERRGIALTPNGVME